MNEGGGYVQFAGQVCLLTSRNPPSSTKHCQSTQCTQVWTAVHCVLSSSALWLIAVFIHTGSFIHWPEKHLGNATCLSNTLSLYSSFQKRGFTKCPSFRFMQKISGNTTHCIGEHNLFFKYFLYLCCLSKACLYEISFIFINVNEYLKNVWLCVINKY